MDLLYGTSKSQHIFLSEIARSLNEKTDLTYTIKRLSRNVARDEDLRRVHDNYLDTIRTSIPDNPLVIVDESDIAKPYAEKMEAFGQIHDGSKKTIEKGYTTINFALSTARTKHPLPLYTHVCSAQEEGFDSMNVEKAKGFNTIDRFMSETACTFVMDRLYDSNEMFKYIHVDKETVKERSANYLEEIEAGLERVVFAKYKDNLGFNRYQFVGVFKSIGISPDNEEFVRYERIDDKVKIIK